MTDSSPGHARQRRAHLAVAEDEWVRAFLRTSPFCHVAAIADGEPYVLPTSFWYDEARERLIFHSSPHGRLRRALADGASVAVSVFRAGRFLPSNAPLELSVQYESVTVAGRVRVLADEESATAALAGFIAKYFPDLRPGIELRPISSRDLSRTAVYAVGIDEWSGKRNWPEEADTADDWAPLGGDSGGSGGQ